GLRRKDDQMQIDLRGTKATELKASDKVVKCQITLPNNLVFGLAAYPGKKKDVMMGSLRTNMTEFLRVKLEKTEDTDIDAEKARKAMSGAADFAEAVKLKDNDEKIKEMQNVLKDHEGKPITMLVAQLLMGALVQAKKDAKDFEDPASIYVKQAEPYGHEMTVGANMDVALMLTAYDKTHEMGLKYAKKASDLVTEDDPKGLAMSAYLAHVLALDKNKKSDDAKPLVAKLEKTAEATVKTAKTDDA